MSVLDNALQTLLGLATEIRELWVNASPKSSFAAQSIGVDLSGYDMVMIQHGTYTNGTLFSYVTDIAPVQKLETDRSTLIWGTLCQSGTAISTRGYNALRDYDKDGNNINFRNGSRTLELTTAADNKLCVPYKIYGIKFLGGGYRIARFIKSLFHIRERGWA